MRENWSTTNYDVYATFDCHDDSIEETYVGTLELYTIHEHSDAPTELELDGIVYKPEL